MWTMDDGIGLTWGMTGAIGPGALPQTHGMRICIVISDSWVWNRSRGLHPEIWPLLTPPLISHNPRGGCQSPSLSGLVSALSCRMELAPIPGLASSSAGMLIPWTLRGCFILPSRPQRAPVLSLCCQHNPRNISSVGTGFLSPLLTLVPRGLQLRNTF